jgi:16S rRNA (cytidine1402-2'-O)-methyltransferase
MGAVLYVVAIPIGNREDITLRALRILHQVDLVICEDFKSGSRLLKSYELKKTLEILNEHNENQQTKILLDRLLLEKLQVALISDAGTPLFADPGNHLVWQCLQNGIKVVPLPGASSLMAALMSSGLNEDRFLYYGFLPANSENRREAIRKIPSHLNVVLLDTPYRLKPLLKDLKLVLGDKRQAILAWKLTYPEEKIFWGSLLELEIQTSDLPKGEFVLILKKVTSGRKK